MCSESFCYQASNFGVPNAVRESKIVSTRYTTFSQHACERITERLTMEPDEVADLLDWNLTVKIGQEKGTGRIHRLFYSHDDHQCFVAIQDEETRTVVTVLPVNYYENLAWKIPKPSIAEAEQLVSCPTERKTSIVAAPANTQNRNSTAPSSFKIIGVLSGPTWKPRIVGLGSWPSGEYGGSVAKLMLDSQFICALQTKIDAKKLPEEYVVGLEVKLGNKVWVDVEDQGLGPIRPRMHDCTS